MIKKVTLLTAAAAGYVLGTRAGRERYEQIKKQATQAWQDPRVQQAASDAQDYVSEQVPVVKHAAQAAAGAAAEKANEVVDRAGQAVDKVSGSNDATDDLEGVDLVAAASDVPDPRDD